MDPQSNTYDYWVYEHNQQIHQVAISGFNDTQLDDSGKWMVFVPKPMINDYWRQIKQLYNDGALIGVLSIKCSTAKENPRARGIRDNGVIILYCVNTSDEEYIMNIGRNITALIDCSTAIDQKHGNYIYYKSDAQTYEGTRATGIKRNHVYKLDINE